VVKWTLNPRDGQRQWTDLEANAVLEDLRTDTRVGDYAGDSDDDDDDNDTGPAVAAKLGLIVHKTAGEGEKVPPLPHNETKENMNQDAEETETGNQAKDEDNSVNGGEEVVQVAQDPVAPQWSYTCGRCSEGIDLDSTFYRCVGHSCRGAFTPQSSIL
jgi:hypothetical protein